MNITIINKASGTRDMVGDTLLDGMIGAQSLNGQITWIDLSVNVARGTYQFADQTRHVAVIDIDKTPVHDAVAAAVWASHF